MKTGEGKTLVATLPAYLNALTGEGVHIVTVNDYLARRDSEWMGKIYKFMGLTVGLIVHDLDNAQRRAAYACDITYGTNNEMGFDYLRDNMVIHERDMVQRGHVYAIVDEVDSILIDEARTPLIISGQGDKSTDLYEKANQFVSRLKNEEDYTIAEKEKAVSLTEQGIAKAQRAFNVENIADLDNAELYHHILAGAQGSCHHEARCGLRGAKRRGHHRGRVHRPSDGGPPLLRRPASGHRGQGACEGGAREQDAGHHHLPELLPHV